jgi:hypothetical protein
MKNTIETTNTNETLVPKTVTARVGNSQNPFRPDTFVYRMFELAKTEGFTVAQLKQHATDAGLKSHNRIIRDLLRVDHVKVSNLADVENIVDVDGFSVRGYRECNWRVFCDDKGVYSIEVI